MYVFLQLQDSGHRPDHEIAAETMQNSKSWLDSIVTDHFQASPHD